jgi:exportin-T
MDDAIARIVQAVAVASNPLEQDKALQVDAVNYLGQVQQNAYRDEVWSLALTLFVDSDENTGRRKYDVQTRLFALRILDEFLDNK